MHALRDTHHSQTVAINTMKINYQLTNSDFLEYQLYESSKSDLHKKERFRSRIMIPIVNGVSGVLLATQSEIFGIGNEFVVFGIALVIIGILWFAFHPLYSRWRIKNHFKKHVEENCKNQINKAVQIEFDENFMTTKVLKSESKINVGELKELIETKDHFFIKLSTDVSLIVPKHTIENQMEFKERITVLGADYVNELNWKWK